MTTGGGQQSASMADGLKKLLGQITQMTVLPDADMQFLSGLQQVVTNYIRQAASQGKPQGPGGPPPDGSGMGPSMGGTPMGQPPGGGMPPGGPPMGGSPGGGGDMGPPPPPQQVAPGGGGPMSQSGLAPQMPNSDELRRILGATGASQ